MHKCCQSGYKNSWAVYGYSTIDLDIGRLEFVFVETPSKNNGSDCQASTCERFLREQMCRSALY